MTNHQNRDNNGRFCRKPAKTNVKIVITVICSITILELYALYLGYNGTLLKLVMMVLAGFGGLIVPRPQFLSKN